MEDMPPDLTPGIPELTPKKPFLNKYRWLILIAFIAIIGITFYLLLNTGNKSATKINSVTNTHKQAGKNLASTNKNVWKGSINPTSIPLGDGHVDTSPQVGYVDSALLTLRVAVLDMPETG